MSVERLPNFFLVGTTKGGTSTLHLWLSQHPNIYLPARKELHYFCTCPSRLKSFGQWDEFVESFSGRTEAIIGEASPCYLYYPGVAESIQRVSPNSRILASLRDPVERFWSHYLMNLTYRENYPEPNEILDKADQARLDATEDLVGMGFYHGQIARYRQVLGKSNVKVVFLEDMSVRPHDVLAEILAFLNLKSYPIDTDQRDKVYVEGRNPLAHFLLRNRPVRRFGAAVLGPKGRRVLKYKLLGQSQSRPEVPHDIATELRSIYKQDSVMLEDSLGIPLPWSWHR